MGTPTLQNILNAPGSDAEREEAILHFFPEEAKRFQLAPVIEEQKPSGVQNQFTVNPGTMAGHAEDLFSGAWRGLKGMAEMPGALIESQAEPAYRALNAARSGDYAGALKQGIRAAVPGLPMAEAMGQDSGNRLVEAGTLASEGRGLEAVAKAGTAIPMVGPMAEVWGEDVASGHPMRAVGEAVAFSLLPSGVKGAPGAIKAAGPAIKGSLKTAAKGTGRYVAHSTLGSGAMLTFDLLRSAPKVMQVVLDHVKAVDGVTAGKAEGILIKMPPEKIASVVEEAMPEIIKADPSRGAEIAKNMAKIYEVRLSRGMDYAVPDWYKAERPSGPYIKPQEPGSVEARIKPIPPSKLTPDIPPDPIVTMRETAAAKAASSAPVLEPPRASDVVPGRDPFKLGNRVYAPPPGPSAPRSVLAEYYNISPDVKMANGAVGIHPELGLPMNAEGKVLVRNVHEFNQNPGMRPDGDVVWRDPERVFGKNPSIVQMKEILEARSKGTTSMGELGDKVKAAFPDTAAKAVKDEDLSYRISHRPMEDAGGASRLHDLTNGAFDENIYGNNALQYYGSGHPREAAVVKVLNGLRGKPNAEVTIYRGVPKDVDKLNPGDWVTLDRKSAQEYALRVNGKVLSKKVPAKDVTASADSLLENGYHPSQSSSADTAARAEIQSKLKPKASPNDRMIGARVYTAEGEAAVETAKADARKAINAEYSNPKERADVIEAALKKVEEIEHAADRVGRSKVLAKGGPKRITEFSSDPAMSRIHHAYNERLSSYNAQERMRRGEIAEPTFPKGDVVEAKPAFPGQQGRAGATKARFRMQAEIGVRNWIKSGDTEARMVNRLKQLYNMSEDDAIKLIQSVKE